MSRSIKKKYFLSHACCQSEKKDKKIWHKSFPCAPVLTEEDIEWLEFGFEEWVDSLEQIDGKGRNKNDDIRK